MINHLKFRWLLNKEQVLFKPFPISGQSRRSSCPSLLALAVRVKRGVSQALEIFEGQAELGEHFFVGNGRVSLEPFLGGFDRAPLFFADRLVVDGSVGQAASE